MKFGIRILLLSVLSFNILFGACKDDIIDNDGEKQTSDSVSVKISASFEPLKSETADDDGVVKDRWYEKDVVYLGVPDKLVVTDGEIAFNEVKDDVVYTPQKLGFFPLVAENLSDDGKTAVFSGNIPDTFVGKSVILVSGKDEVLKCGTGGNLLTYPKSMMYNDGETLSVLKEYDVMSFYLDKLSSEGINNVAFVHDFALLKLNLDLSSLEEGDELSSLDVTADGNCKFVNVKSLDADGKRGLKNKYSDSFSVKLDGRKVSDGLLSVYMYCSIDRTESEVGCNLKINLTLADGSLLQGALDNADKMIVDGCFGVSPSVIMKKAVNPVIDIEKVEGVYNIYTAHGLKKFASIVNEGETDAKAVLMDDIDMTGISEWTPIGNATLRYLKNGDRVYDVEITGNTYGGMFDGNGKTIKNINLNYSETVSGGTFGLFGLLHNAVVKNLNIGEAGDNSKLTVATAGKSMQDIGILAGCCSESTVADVVNNVSLLYNGTTNTRITLGVIGCVYSDEKSSTVENLKNKADFIVESSENTVSGWPKAIHVGGISGAVVSSFIPDNPSVNFLSYLNYCSNEGNITSNAGKTGGITASATYYAYINSCVNSGNITNTSDGYGYSAGIAGYISDGTKLDDCSNSANVIATKGGMVSGIVGMSDNDNNEVRACSSFGEIISDGDRGIFVATNAKKSLWSECTAAGKLGKYNNGTYQYDIYPADLKNMYLGGGANLLRLENINNQMGDETIDEGEADLRILFIGNSFTKDATDRLPALLEGSGITTVDLGFIFKPGSEINEHVSIYSTEELTYYSKPVGLNGKWYESKGVTIEEAVNLKKWDVITIQEHTGRNVSWIWDDFEKNAINTLLDKVMQAQQEKFSNVPKIYYILSQAYHSIGGPNSTTNETYGFKDSFEHYNAIANQAKSIDAEIARIDGFISTGTALQNLRTSKWNDVDELTRDGYHMDNGISRYAAACVVFEMLIKDKFNSSLEDNTYRITDSNQWTTPVIDEDGSRTDAIKAARYAVDKPFEITDMSSYSGGDGSLDDIENGGDWGSSR